MKRYFTIAAQFGSGARLFYQGMLKSVLTQSLMGLVAILVLGGCLPSGGPQNGDARGITGLQIAIGQQGQPLQALSQGGNVGLNLVLSANQNEAQMTLENDSAFAVTLSQVSIEASNADQIAQQGLVPGAVIASGAQLQFTLGLVIESDGSKQASLSFGFTANGQTSEGLGCAVAVGNAPTGTIMVNPSTINIPAGASYQGTIATQPQVGEGDGATFAVFQQPHLGTVVFTDTAIGGFTYTPNPLAPQVGQDGFMVAVTDDKGRTIYGEVTLVFTGVPASDIQVVGHVNEAVFFVIPVAMADGSIVLNSLPQSGSLSLAQNSNPLSGPAPVTLQNGVLYYTADPGTTTDSFTYQIVGPDPQNPGQTLSSRVATVNVTVP